MAKNKIETIMLGKYTVIVRGPKHWDDTKVVQTCDRIDDLVEKLETAMRNRLREISPELTGSIE